MIKKVSILEAASIIENEGLEPYFGTWHYAYNIGVFYDSMLYDGKSVYSNKQINKWSPPPVYTKENIVPGNDGPYWFLRLTTLYDFLRRRSETSSNPKKHFPSLETYAKTERKMASVYLDEPYNKKLFVDDYDSLRKKEHLSGRELINTFWETNKRFPIEWLRVVRILNEGRLVAIYLIADDGRSYSDLNSASIIDSSGWCIYGLVKIIEYLCGHGYRFFDCGISGDYGGYKKKIFLDSVGLKNVRIN